jgi:hypothetical protein
MDKANMARILQNMIDEAEEHLSELNVRFRDSPAVLRRILDKRHADLAEAIKLEDELEAE